MQKHNITLDAMRGIAALCVVLFHADKLMGGTAAPHGYLAVDFFFVLSGYVIAKAYDSRLAEGWAVRDFTLARVLRFYPLYSVGLFMGAVEALALMATNHPHAPTPFQVSALIGLGLLFIPSPFASRHQNLFDLNVPSWSLCFELMVNIVYALFVHRFGRAALLLWIAFSGVGVAAFIVHFGSADFGSTGPKLLAGVIRTLFSFLVGVLLFKFPVRMPSVNPFVPLVALGLALLAPASIGATFDILFVLLLSPGIVALGVNSAPPRRLTTAFEMAGVISFPIYAVHTPILLFGEVLAKRLRLDGLAIASAIIPALIISSYWLGRRFDPWARDWLRQLNVRRSADPPQPVVR